MKRAVGYGLCLLLIFVWMLSFSGCAASGQPSSAGDPLLGRWEDTYGLTEYEFLEDGKLKIFAFGIAFDGTYERMGSQMTISYTVLGSVERNTYQFDFQGDRFFLDQAEFLRK